MPAQASAAGGSPPSDPVAFVAALGALQSEVRILKDEMVMMKRIRGSGGGGQDKDKGKKDFKELKSFSSVPSWDGCDQGFGSGTSSLH